MKTIKSYYFFVFIILFLSCKTQNLFIQEKSETTFQHIQVDSAFLFNENYQYRIRKDDKISLSFWGHDDLSVGSIYGIYNSNEVYGKWLMVDAEGKITLPRIGKFSIQDLTVIQAKDSITNILNNGL